MENEPPTHSKQPSVETNNEPKIIYKYIGPLNKKIIKNEIIPLL